MKIGMDLDGVTCDFNGGWMERYNGDFSANIQYEDAVGWDCPVDLTHFDTMDEFWHWIINEHPRLFGTLKPLPKAIPSLIELSDKHDIIVQTARPDWAIADTYYWLGWYGIPASEVHITYDKTKTKCDLYVDDGSHNLEDLVATHPDSTVIRYRHGWNYHVDGTIGVDDWDELKQAIKEHS